MIDLAPTFLELTGTRNPVKMTGKSFLKILLSSKSGIIDPSRKTVLTGRERHSQARFDNVGYPARAIRTHDYLFILNLKPDRWPAGDPVTDKSSAIWPGYWDIDDGPTKLLMASEPSKWRVPFRLGYEKRPEEQLYDIRSDQGCVTNLAGNPSFDAVKRRLRKELEAELTRQGDPRLTGNGDIFDSYPRFGAMRNIGGFNEEGKYNPAFMKK
jgi:uncharacterized sulfatase